MKKVWTRLIAVLMALSCAITLFGCAEEDDSSIRRRKSKKETTEDVSDFEETMDEVLWEEQEETKKNWGQVDEKVEAETTAPLVDAKVDPGSIQLPAVELFDYDYDTLCKMNWLWLTTERSDNRWVLTTEIDDATFTFIFEDLDSKAIVLTVDDWTNSSQVYISYDIQLNDTAQWLPNDVQKEIGPMDGGLYATGTLNGYEADFLFDGDMDNVDEAVLYCVQLRREN